MNVGNVIAAPADALLLYGVTGDLAHMKIFPARYAPGNFPQALTHMTLIYTAPIRSISAGKMCSTSTRGERPVSVAPAS